MPTCSWTKEELALRLGPLVASFFPDRGDIHVVVAIVAGGQHYFLTFSRQANQVGPAVNEETIFEIGSTTMAFTACLLADMVAKDEVALTDPARLFLPAGVRVPSYRGQEITLLDLATHTSALPRLPGNFPKTVIDPANPCGNYTVNDLYAFLSGYRLRHPIGWRRQYSNLGMGLLGHTLALAAGQDYQETLLERICKPLELRDTTVTLTAAQSERFVQGHSAQGVRAAPWDMPALVGAGGLRSTARELLRFLEIHLGKNGVLGTTAAMSLTPRPKTGRPAPWPLRFGVAIGLSVLGLTALWHLSMIPGQGWFLPLFLLPVLAATLYGGLAAGLLAVVSQGVGASLLYGGLFNPIAHGAASLLLAWLASSNHRERARKEMLGWHQAWAGLLRPAQSACWHSGETGGCASFIGIGQDRDTAVVVLANCAKPVSHLGFQVLNLLNER